jgi:hypothetical protein
MGVISYGLSSYGYDARVADEFKIFTNVDSAMVDPKDFSDPTALSIARPMSASSRPTVRAGPHGRIFPHPARRAGDLPWAKAPMRAAASS